MKVGCVVENESILSPLDLTITTHSLHVIALLDCVQFA